MANIGYSIIPNSRGDWYYETDFREDCGKSVEISGCMLILCTSGCAVFSIDFKHYPVRKGDFISLSYEMTFIPVKVSSAFSAKVVSLPMGVCENAFYKITDKRFWDYLLRHPLLNVNTMQYRLLESWFGLSGWMVTHNREGFAQDMLQQHFCNLFMALCSELSGIVGQAVQEDKKNRGWYLAGRFMDLVSRNYKKYHDVNYYARRLSITPEYLCKLTYKVYGEKPKELIDRQIIAAMKSFLSTTDLSVKNIACELNFADPSYMCRYFKRATGLSPLEYRNKHET